MTKLALIISENRTIEVRQSTLSNFVWVDIKTDQAYFSGELKFISKS